MTPWREAVMWVAGLVLLASGMVTLLDTWWAVSGVLLGITWLSAALLAAPLLKAQRALDTLYRLADGAVWKGTEAVSAEEIAEVIERASPADGEQRRGDWARYRAFLAADREKA